MTRSFLLELVVNSAMIIRFKSTELNEKVVSYSLHRNRVFLSLRSFYVNGPIVIESWLSELHT